MVIDLRFTVFVKRMVGEMYHQGDAGHLFLNSTAVA
jgi:hypothetical protein